MRIKYHLLQLADAIYHALTTNSDGEGWSWICDKWEEANADPEEQDPGPLRVG